MRPIPPILSADLSQPRVRRGELYGDVQQKPDLHRGGRHRGFASLLGSVSPEVALFLALSARLAAGHQALGVGVQSAPTLESALSQLPETRHRSCFTSSLDTPAGAASWALTWPWLVLPTLFVRKPLF